MTIVRWLPAAVVGARVPAAVPLCLLGLLLLSGCQNTDEILKPGDVGTEVLRAIYVPDSVFVENPIELNGEMLEREWGGPLDADLPFHQVRVTAEDGEGQAGPPSYVAMKCIYTDSDIYFLFRWPDPDPSEVARPLVYVGPDYDPASEDCSDNLVRGAFWIQLDEVDEDRLVVQFDIPDVEGASPGRRDVWEWLADRTNVLRNLYSREEDPRFPVRGLPGYMEDELYDPAFGRFFDPGAPPWRRNHSGSSLVPNFVYRQRDDVFFENPDGDQCRNGFGGECLTNNGLPFFYLWREDGNANTDPFFACDTTNFFPNNLVDDTDDDEPRYWKTFDAVSSFWYTYPEGSRADVRAKAQWVEGVWTLEVGRPLNTGDLANDVRFQTATGGQLRFTVQVYNASPSACKGSGPQVLWFSGPRDADPGQTRGKAS